MIILLICGKCNFSPPPTLALPTQDGGVPYYKRNNSSGTNIANSTWHKFITDENIGEYSGAKTYVATSSCSTFLISNENSKFNNNISAITFTDPDDGNYSKTFTPIISKDPNSKRSLIIWPKGGKNSSILMRYALNAQITDENGKSAEFEIVDSVGLSNVLSDMREDMLYYYAPTITSTPSNSWWDKGYVKEYEKESFSKCISYYDYKIMFGYESWGSYSSITGNPVTHQGLHPTIKFPTSFDKIPIVAATIIGMGYYYNTLQIDTIRRYNFSVYDIASSYSSPENIPGCTWIAIGE